MIKLNYKNLSFLNVDEGIKVRFLKYYFFTIENDLISQYGKITADKNDIIFEEIDDLDYAEKVFNRILNKKFLNLKSLITKNPVTYIHKNSGNPLIGLRYIGIQDRGSNLLEIKPITGCNAGCTFCSVDEGIGSKKTHDFVVEKDYLIEEAYKLLDFKDYKGMHIYINVHGEPLLYADLSSLIQDLKRHSTVDQITIITNGMLLTPNLVSELKESGLTGMHISISGASIESSIKLMGTNAYNIDMIKKKSLMCKEHGLNVSITPVWLDKVNDNDIETLVQWCKENSLEIRIQKFCKNKAGRNPVKEISWDEFFNKIKQLEKKYDYKLTEELYKLPETKTYPIPFKKGEIVECQIIGSGRYDNEKIAIAKDRLISLPGCYKNGKLKVKILRTTNNIFVAK